MAFCMETMAFCMYVNVQPWYQSQPCLDYCCVEDLFTTRQQQATAPQGSVPAVILIDCLCNFSGSSRPIKSGNFRTSASVQLVHSPFYVGLPVCFSCVWCSYTIVLLVIVIILFSDAPDLKAASGHAHVAEPAHFQLA